MTNLEKTIKRFELFAEDAKDRDIVEVPDDLIFDTLELLKQCSRLTKALEQSNAVNEYLNAEIERLKGKDQVFQYGDNPIV